MKQQAPAAQSAPSMMQPPGPSVKPNQFYPEGIVIGGEKTLDMMIPGTKVGYVIGKGGEMIRTLQVSSCLHSSDQSISMVIVFYRRELV